MELALNEQKLTKVLTKTNTNIDDPKCATITVPVTFQDLIHESSMWVDKSLIIKEIWKENSTDVFVVTAPRRWGKTMILTMLDFYHQLPINDDGSVLAARKTSRNYLYFTEGKIIDRYLSSPAVQCDSPPLISGEEFLNNERLANHPVIHMIGTVLKIEEDYIGHFRTMIWRTYKKHTSLLRFLEKKLSITNNDAEKTDILRDLNKFEDCYHWHKIQNLDENVLQFSIQDLSELLEKTYRRKVIILFDEYDFFVSNTYLFGEYFLGLPSPQVTYDFADFLQGFMYETFKANTHLVKGVITGVLPILETTGLSGLNNVALKYVFGSDSFFPYYGIFEHEFLDLVSKRGIDQSLIKHAVARYDCYRVLNHLGDRMFSTFSTIGFVNQLVVNNYWIESNPNDYVEKLFQQRNFTIDMAKVIRNWRRNKSAFAITYKQMTELTLQNFETIYNLSSKEMNYESGKHRNLVFSFFVSVGFLSVHENQSTWKHQQHDTKPPETVDITIPNMEIYSKIKSYYIDSLREHAGFSPLIESAQRARSQVMDYMSKNNSITLQLLAQSISEYTNMLKSTKHILPEEINVGVESLSEIFHHCSSTSVDEKTFKTLLMAYFFKNTEEHATLEDHTDFSPKQLLEQQVVMDKTYARQEVDIFYNNDRKFAIILELKYLHEENAKISTLEEAFQQCLGYTLLFRSFKPHDVPVVSFLAVLIHQNMTMELMSIGVPPNEVKEWISDSDSYSRLNSNLEGDFLCGNWSNNTFTTLKTTMPSRIWYAKHDPNIPNL